MCYQDKNDVKYVHNRTEIFHFQKKEEESKEQALIKELNLLSACSQIIGLNKERVTGFQGLNDTPFSTWPTHEGAELLTQFFSRTQANEKAEIKFLLDPEQVLRESINIRTVAKKIEFPVVGNGKPVLWTI